MRIEKELSAARITIRNYQKSDLPFLTDMWFDEENGKFLSDPTREYVDDIYQKALDSLEDSPNGYYLTVMQKNSNKIIGSCFLFPDDNKEFYHIGYCIHKSCWRQGFGTELLSLAKDWIRSQGGIGVIAEVAKENIASNELLRKSGFEVLRETQFKKYNMDVSYDGYLYKLML